LRRLPLRPHHQERRCDHARLVVSLSKRRSRSPCARAPAWPTRLRARHAARD
jgi:hypothetical protein